MTIEQLHQEFLQSEGVCTDTRKEVKGTLFFALRGERFDGNRYVPDAIEKGCRLAVSSDREMSINERVVYTPSPLGLLQELAAFHRRYAGPVVMAITGSNGKTTTRDLVKAILERKYSVLATVGNLNNHIGVPLTLLSLKQEEVAVIEMGANHAGEIRDLAAIASPDLGLITNVGKAHLEGFGSVDGVLEAKGELYEYLAKNGGKALVDGGDRVLLQKASDTGVETLVVGEGGDIPVSGRIIGQNPFLEIELKVKDQTHRVTSGLVGPYNLQNIVLAAAAGYHFDLPGPDIAGAVASYKPENNRSQLIEGARNRVVMDSYNANPTSMREAIAGLLEYASSPVMLILGDMAELGTVSKEEHLKLYEWIGSLSTDRVLLVGPLFSEVIKPAGNTVVFSGVDELVSHLESDPPEGYHILVKGSRVMELERLIPFLVK